MSPQLQRSDAGWAVALTLFIAPAGLDAAQTCQVGGSLALKASTGNVSTVSIPSTEITISSAATGSGNPASAVTSVPSN